MLPTLVADDYTKKYGEEGAFKVKVLDGHGRALSGASVSFNIAKAHSALDINGTSIYFGEVAILNYTTVNATGIEVTITDCLAKTLTEGVDYNITITDSQIIVMFFDDGTYTVNATTKTDKNQHL